MQERPKPKNKYCQICQEDFTNYDEHIGSAGHDKKMRECWGYKKLLKVCEKMKGKTSEKTEKTKEDQVGKMETDV